MLNKIKLSISSTLILILSASTLHATPKEFTLDKGHAYIGFEVDHMGLARTVGEFKKFDGSFLIDEEDMAKTKITFTVDPASLDSNHSERDKHLKSADYLDVKKYPEIRFESSSVTMLTPESGKLHGTLSMLGVTKPLTLNFKKVKDAPYPAFIPNYDEIRAMGFEASGEILRLDWGMDFIGFPGSPSGLAVQIKAYFDLVDCSGKPKTNIPCNWGR